jgi:hypothetical protein
MKAFASVGIWLLWVVSVWGAEPSVPAPSESEQRERLFQRFLAEMHAAISVAPPFHHRSPTGASP